ncbi:MAG: hypothetical protein ACRDOL_26105 [Streptosporangiaceae bacterium]
MTSQPASGKAAEAARLYASGLSSREVGAALGVDGTTIVRWLGGSTRPRGRRPRPGTADTAVVRALEDRRLSWAEVSARTGLTRTGARKRYKGITGREPPHRLPGRHDVRTARIVRLRDRSAVMGGKPMSWAEIGRRVGMSGTGARGRYLKSAAQAAASVPSQ